MKNLIWIPLFLIVIAVIQFYGCQKNSTDTRTNKNASEISSTKAQQSMDTADLPENRVELYYFHATRRCPTCTHAERWTEKTLEDHYSAQLENNQLVYRAINYEKKENRALAERFQIPFNGLVINVVKGSNENHYFLEKLFQQVHKGETATIDFLKQTIDNELDKL